MSRYYINPIRITSCSIRLVCYSRLMSRRLLVDFRSQSVGFMLAIMPCYEVVTNKYQSVNIVVEYTYSSGLTLLVVIHYIGDEGKL